MQPRRCIDLGHLMPPRANEALHYGEVHDGGSRIRIWATTWQYGIIVTCPIQTTAGLDAYTDHEEAIDIMGDAKLSIGRGLSCEQAEALIAELQLAVRAKRLHDGEPWNEREIAPGIVRTPVRSEA